MRLPTAVFVFLLALIQIGCDFVQDQYDPTVQVSQIVLTEAPLVRSNGQPWDEDGPADVQVEVQTLAGTAIRKSQVYTDLAVLPDGGLVIDFDFPVDTDDNYIIALLDIDGRNEVPQVMGYTERFDYEMLNGSVGGAILVRNPDGSTQAVLSVEPGS